MRDSDGFIIPMLAAIGIVVVSAILALGCATAPPPKPSLPPMKLSACVDWPMPERERLGVFSTRTVEVADAEGVKHEILFMMVDPASMSTFNDYLMALEGVAKRAVTCVRAPLPASMSGGAK